MDIQMMRSDKLGYNAPIEVYDNKYYRYADPEYSITNSPLTDDDMKLMGETVEMLRQFEGFSVFSGMEDVLGRLEDHVTSMRHKSRPVILLEKNDSLKGLKYIDPLYKAIIAKKPVKIIYKSFKARDMQKFIFSPFFLKEFRIDGLSMVGRRVQECCITWHWIESMRWEPLLARYIRRVRP